MKQPPALPSEPLLLKQLRTLPKLWYKAVEPTASILDPEIRRRMRLFNGLLVMIIPVALVTFVAQYVFSPTENAVRSQAFLQVAMSIAIALLFYVLNRVTTSFRLMSFAFIGAGFVAILGVAVTANPPHFQFVFLLFLPLIGTMLFSLSEVFLLCLLTLACVVVVAAPMPTMPRDLLKSLLVFLTLAQAFILFVAQQRNQLEKDRQQLALLKARNEFLNEIIIQLSHDFRTPLTIINTSAYLLGQSADPLKRQEKIERISQQITRLNGILDDILLISRLNHTLNVSLEVVDVNRPLQTVIERFRPLAKNKNLQVTVDLAQDLPPVFAHPEYLEEAFARVIENALQFTPSGGSITIHTFNRPGQVVIETADTGIGVNAADLPLIFDPFFRGDRARSTETGKAGLGLSIARRIVEMHEGTIEVESVPAYGSTLRIALPSRVNSR